MKLRIAFLLAAVAAAGAALPAAAGGKDERQPSPFVRQVADRVFTVSGTVASVHEDSVVVRIDDHGHLMPFTLGREARNERRAKPGDRVTVRYHPDGESRQIADKLSLR